MEKVWIINVSNYDDYAFFVFSTKEKAEDYARGNGWTDEPEEMEMDPVTEVPPDDKWAFKLLGRVSDVIRNDGDFVSCYRVKYEGEFPRITVGNTYVKTNHPAGYPERVDIGFSVQSMVEVHVLAYNKEEAKNFALKEFWAWMHEHGHEVAKTQEDVDRLIEDWKLDQIPPPTT